MTTRANDQTPDPIIALKEVYEALKIWSSGDFSRADIWKLTKSALKAAEAVLEESHES